MARPNPGTIPRSGAGLRPASGDNGQRQLIRFSFRFFKQIEHFGFEGLGAKWFAAFFARLHELSHEPVERFRDARDRDVQRAMRYHDIDWTRPNVPVKREDFHWLPPEYRDDERTYPFVQLQVSTGKGRIVGFWGGDLVFNVLLCDPKHNMQPSKHYDYKVDASPIVSCRLTELSYGIDQIQRNKSCTNAACETMEEIVRLSNHRTIDSDVCVVYVRSPDIAQAEKFLRAGKAKSLADIFAAGLLHFDALG